METQEITLKVRFVAKTTDILGYSNYVFENLNEVSYDEKYIMCVRFPNWNQKPFELQEEGFVTVRYVKAGVDTWYDGEKLVPYKYTNIIFLKFISLPKTNESKDVIID